jgi:hypothetical protein
MSCDILDFVTMKMQAVVFWVRTQQQLISSFVLLPF